MGKKEQKGRTWDLLGLQRSPLKADGFLALQREKKTEKEEGAFLPIHRFLGPSPPAVLGGSTGS